MKSPTIQHTETVVHTGHNTIEGVFRGTIGAMISFAGITGLWSMAAMISALFQAGGPGGLFRAWITAVTGV